MRLLLFALVCTTAALAQPQHQRASRTGWISDEACGAQHAKPGGAGCVEKCWRGGASVGHPEWKPQRAVFVQDGDHAIWIVLNPDAVKNFAAVHVELGGEFDLEKKTVQVDTVTRKAD